MKNLPDTILLHIIHYLKQPLFDYLRDFKPLLALVQVNQRWRQAIQNIVYDALWLEYWGDSMPNKEELKKMKKRRYWSKYKENPRFSWQTNLPLLHIPPRSLRIQALDFDHEFLYFHQLLPHLHHLPLKGVKELEIPSQTWSNNLSRPLPTEISQQQAQTIDGLVEYLIHAMPDIQKISTPHGLNHSLATDHLTHCLVLRYWSQLHSLDAPQLKLPLPVLDLQMSLTHLNVHSDSLVDFPLNGCPQLRSLALSGLKPFFSWDHMFRGLEFPHLHSLSLLFAHDRAVTDSHWSDSLRSAGQYNRSVTMGISAQPIEFPQLHKLLVANVPYTYSQAWAMFVRVGSLRSLNVKGPFGHIKYLDPQIMANLEALHIGVYSRQNSPIRMFPFLQQLFAESPGSLCKLSFSNPSTPLPLPAFPAESIAAGWSSLHTLVLSTYVPAVALVSLLCQLPRLYRLVADTIANNENESLAARKASQKFRVDANELLTPSEFPPPASLSIRHLQLHMEGYLYQKPTLQAIIYILLSCPQTKQLMVRTKYYRPIQDFLQLHQALYPQLAQNLVL